VAAAEGLHRRPARERGLDAARRSRRVQPLARRDVPELLAWASAISVRRTAAG
jgi:hypothetical protein